MMIGTQVLRPGTFDRHLVARKYARKKSRRVLLTALSLTSMVDMFSLLVIFLLQTFSTSPEMLMVGKGVELPSARSGIELVDAPVLAVTDSEIYLDQKKIGDTTALLRDPSPLMEKLSDLRELWQKTHPNDTFKGEINLQAHRNTPSTVVSKVMGMLPSQHYGSIQLIVMSGGGPQ